LIVGAALAGAGQDYHWRLADGQYTTAQLARRVAYLFQNPDEQLCQRTVWAEVAFGPRQLGYSETAVVQQVSFVKVDENGRSRYHILVH
jgi:energy-coupling factor transporter ATP-binding protein EcfA2